MLGLMKTKRDGGTYFLLIAPLPAHSTPSGSLIPRHRGQRFHDADHCCVISSEPCFRRVKNLSTYGSSELILSEVQFLCMRLIQVIREVSAQGNENQAS